MATLYVFADEAARTAAIKADSTKYTESNTFASLNTAVQAASDEDTIIVNAGDYTSEGTITIDKSITIKAANAATTAADADKAIIDNIVINGGSADNLLTVEIDGLQINAETINDNRLWSQGVYLGTLCTESVTVKNCNIDLTNGQPGSSGIKMSLNGGDKTKTIVIENNIITGSAENTNSLIHIGDKESLESLSVKDNTLSGCSSHGMNFDFSSATAYSIEIDNNEVSVCGRDGIKLAGLKDADSTVTIIGNEVTNVNNAKCEADDAAIALRGTGELKTVTVTDNEISNAQVGVYFDSKVVNDAADDQAADITVSNNNITVVEKHAPVVGETPVVSGGSGFEPAADANTVTVIESATSIIVDASIAGNVGDIVAINGKNYIIGTNAFANLTDAVNAASATEATTITVATGTYNEDITLDARYMEQKGDIKFIAAEGADVTFTGLFTIGYYEKRVGNKDWKADVTFENITFDQADDAKNSIDIQQCKGFAMINCKVIGYGECGILGTTVGNGSTITGTTFENAAIQSAGSFGTNLLIEDCTFVESCVNFQSGNSVTVKDCSFDNTLTDAANGGSFYVVRSNDVPVKIEGCTFNVDSTASVTTIPQVDANPEIVSGAKWGSSFAVFCQRTNGTVKWDVENVTVNFSEAALANENLFVNYTSNQYVGTTERITITNISSETNDVADLLEKTNKTVIVKETNADDEVVSISTYKDGALESVVAADEVLYLNGESYTADLEYKIITANSGKNTFDGNDVSAKNVYVGYSSDEAADLALVNGAHVNAAIQIVVGNDSELTVDADSMVATQSDCLQVRGTAIFDGGLAEDQKVSQELVASEKVQGKLNYLEVYPTGDMQLVNGAAVSTKAHVDVYNKLSIDNSRFETASQEGKWLSGTHTNHYGGFYIRENSVVSVSNGGLLAIGGEYRGKGYALYNEGTLEIKNGAQTVVSFNAVNAKDIKVSNGGVLKVGANFIADTTFNDFSLVNNGTIEVAGGIVEAGTVTNEDTFKVTGSEASTVKATITGNALQLENGVLENSEIDGKIRVYGNSVIQGSANEYDGDELVKDNSTKLGIVEINFENTKVNGYRPSYSETPVTLTIQGTNITTSTVYVGNDTVPADNPDYVAGTLKVIGDNDKSTVDLTTGNVYNRINGYIEISEANVVMTQLQNYGEVLVKSGSVLDLTHADSFTVCSKDDTTVANDCAVLTVDGATVLGGKMYIGQEASGGSSETATAVGSGKVVLSNGASLNLKNNLWMLKEDDKFDVSMEVSSDSTLTVGGKLFMGSGSSVTVDVAGIKDVASITAGALAGDGTITVNVADDFSGIYKVIELSGTESLKDRNIVYVNAADNVSVVYGDDGDVTLVKVDTATLYVNSDWSEYSEGEAIPGTDGKLAYGFNAFASINDAIKAAEKNGGAMIDLTTSKFSGSEAGLANANLFQTNGTYTFTGGDYIDFAYVDTPRPTEENAGKVSVNIVFDKAKVTAGKFRLDNGSSLEIKDSYIDAQSASGASTGWTTFYGDSTITVENSVIGWFTTRQTMESDEIVAGDQKTNYLETNGLYVGRMCYCGSGVMTVTNSTVFTYPNEGDAFSLAVYDKGLMSFTNSAVYAYSLAVGRAGNKTVGRDDEVATMSFENSTLRTTTTNGTSTERIVVGGANEAELIFNNSTVEKSAAAMTVESNGTVTIQNTVFAVSSLNNSGTFNVAGSSLDVVTLENNGEGSVVIKKYVVLDEEGNVTEVIGSNAEFGSVTNAENAKIEVSDSTFTAETVTNNGTFTVSGESTLNIGELTGGSITALDGAVLTDSIIASTTSQQLVVGEGGYNATVTFKGDNEIGKIAAFSGSSIIVGQDGSLKLTANRSGFGNGATWDIDGNIENAKDITDEQKADLKVSLNLVNGLSMSTTNGDDSVMNIDNAYVVFGNAVTSKNTNSAGGSFDINVTNSIIDAANNFGVYSPTAENSPVYDIDFKDSVLNFNSNLLNADKNSSMTFDNSKVTVKSSFRNDGTFELLNKSDMTVEAYIQESSGNAGMFGSVLIDDSKLTIKNSTEGHKTINRGSIELTNAASFTADYVENDSDATISVASSNLTVTNLTNNGTISISGASDFAADVTTGGDSIAKKGKIYMDSVTLDEDTQITGDAFIRFASGENTLDGVSIEAGYFQVGQGANVSETSGNFEERIESINGVTVNVKNASIKVDSSTDYTGWIGGRYNPETGAAENPDAKYVLNLENSDAYFGYLHTYTDGTLNYTATAKDEDGKFVNTFHGGRFNVSGAANFDGGDLEFIYAIVNSNGQMSIKNADVLFSAPNSSSTATLSIAGDALVDISNSNVAFNKTMNIAEGGELKLTDVVLEKSNNDVTINNNGTITVAGTTSVASNTFNNYGTLDVAGTAEFDSVVNAGTVNVSEFVTEDEEGNEVTNASNATFDSIENNEGATIAVTGSSFTAGKVINNGDFTVTGESTLNIGEVDGRITLADATLKSGSVIGNADAPAGCVDIIGSEVNFENDTVINAAVNANIKDADGKDVATEINIAENAVVTWNTKQYSDGTYSGGFNTDASDKLNVGGTLNISGDNVYLKAEALVAESGELNINGAGFQNTLSEMTVKGTLNISNSGVYAKLAGNEGGANGSMTIDGGEVNIALVGFSVAGGYAAYGWNNGNDITPNGTLEIINGGSLTSNSETFRNGVNGTITIGKESYMEFVNPGEEGFFKDYMPVNNDNIETEALNEGTFNVAGSLILSSHLGNGTFVNKGTFTVEGGSVEANDFTNRGSVSLTSGATLSVAGDLTNDKVEDGTGVINLEVGSSIKANTFTSDGTLDITYSTDGVWKIIDLGTDSTFTGVGNFGNITIGGAAAKDGQLAFDNANKDLYFVNVSDDVIYFNNAWSGDFAASLAGKTYADTVVNGKEVEIDGDTKAIKFYAGEGKYTDYAIDKDVVIETIDGKINMDELTADADLTVKAGTSFDMSGKLVVNADKSVAVDGKLVAGMVDNNGTVEIGEDGFAEIGAIESEGSFVINVGKDFAGAKKVIDLAASEDGYTWNNGVTVEGDAEGDVKAFYNKEGDVAVSNADMTNFVFNSAWAGKELAANVEGEGTTGSYFGINAFDDIDAMGDQQKDADGMLLAEKLTFYAGDVKYTDLELNQKMTVESKANGEKTVVVMDNLTTTNKLTVAENGKFEMTGALQLNGEYAVLDVAKDTAATFGSIALSNDAVAVQNVAGTLNVAGNAAIRNMNIAGTGVVNVGSATVTANDEFKVEGKFTAGSMVIGDENAENSTSVVISGTEKFVKVTGEVTVNGAAEVVVTDNAEFSFGTLVNNNVITVNNATLGNKESSIANDGSIVIKGVSTVYASITGENGSVKLESGATLNGSLMVEDSGIEVGKNTVLGENATLEGLLLNGSISVKGDDNVLNITAGSTTTLIVDNTTKFDSLDKLGDILIKGASEDVTLTVADSALQGNTFDGVKLAITDLEDDKEIKADIELASIVSINGYALQLENGLFYYIDKNAGNKKMFVNREESNAGVSITITNSETDTTELEYEGKNFKVTEGSDDFANVKVIMQEGKTNFTVKNGKKDQYIEYAVGGIGKDENGGTNNVKFGNYTKVKVNGDIEAISNLTIGNKSVVTIGKPIYGDPNDANKVTGWTAGTGNIFGQNNNNTVKIGSDSKVTIAGNIYLAGGKNKLAIGARSDVEIGGNIDGATNFTVASGKKAKKDGSGADWTNVTITGNYVAAKMNNNLTIGNYVNFTLGQVGGVSIDNGGVSSGTGTKVKVGTESTMTVAGSANGIAGITTGKKSYVVFGTETKDAQGKVTGFTGTDIDGTDKNNKISVGAEATFKAGAIDLAGGKNNITTGKASEFVAGTIDNVQTIKVGSQSSFTTGDIVGVNKFTVGNGKAATKKAEAIITKVNVGKVTMTTGNDAFKVGNYSDVVVTGDIVFGAGKDTLTIGKDAKLTVNDITGMDKFNASKGAQLVINNGAKNDVDFDLVTGSWDKATIIDMEGDLAAGNINGNVYANELDCYEVTVGNKLTLSDIDGDEKVTYSKYDAVKEVWSDFKDYTDGLELTAGTYRIEVSVAGEYTDKLEKKSYSFTAELA